MADEPTIPFVRAKAGYASRHDQLRYPRLNLDNSVYLDSDDGTSVVTAPVRAASHYYQSFAIGVTFAHTLRSMQAEKNTVHLYDMQLMVTDSRVIVHKRDPKVPNLSIVAHLRYPWVSTVRYRPKQSFLNDAALNLDYAQQFPLADRGWWSERLEFIFNKRIQPGELAQEIVRRIAIHHLRHGVPEGAVSATRALLQSDKIADPAKGEFASYEIPAYVSWPGGVPYIQSDGETTWEWITQSSASTPSASANGERGSGSDEPTVIVAGKLLSDEPDLRTEVKQPAERQVKCSEDSSGRRLKLRERLSLLRDIAMAHRAYRADRDEEAAAAYDQVLKRIEGTESGVNYVQEIDLMERAAGSHAAAGNIEQAVSRLLGAIRIADRERDEPVELASRLGLADTLHHSPEHELYTPNLRRISELSDALRTRQERVDIHLELAKAFQAGEYFEDAASEYKAIARLRQSLGGQHPVDVAQAWQAQMLHNLGRHAEADVVWDLRQPRPQVAEPSSGPEERFPTMFDQFGPAARQAVVHARQEAAQLGHSQIGPEHLLLGAAVTDELAGTPVGEMGAAADLLREQIRERFPCKESLETPTGYVPFNDEATIALRRAYDAAIALAHGQISTGHLLIGVAHLGVVDEILSSVGIDGVELAEKVRRTAAR